MVYTGVLIDLAYLKGPVVSAFQVVSFTRKKHHFQPSVKLLKIIKHLASKQQFLPEMLSKLNSSLYSDLLIKCQIKHIVRKHNGAMQNHSMLRPGYRSARFIDTKCTVGILRTYCHSICGEKN